MARSDVYKRDKYLNELILRMDNGLIKVVTGLRRSGKSYLLFKLFKDYLIESGVKPENIITLELDNLENERYKDPLKLLAYIKENTLGDEKYYVILDEIQNVKRFESVLNSLMHRPNLDIYVTGSNSRFLSKDILTEFRGRGDEVHLLPLSFSEYYAAVGGDKIEAWYDYYTFGGLPMIIERKTVEQKANYLSNLFKETYIKDIVDRHNIDNPEEFEDIINILASAVGSLTNPTKVYNTIKSIRGTNTTIARGTVNNYIEYLEDSFLIEKAQRFDVKGKKYIDTPYKFYFSDVGLRNARLNFRQQEENHIMENIIYNELLYRGYNVDVGVVETSIRDEFGKSKRVPLEIDFVCNQGSKRYYVQSAFSLPTADKTNQELRPLLKVADSFKKIVVVRDFIMPKRDESGIVTMNIIDFLLDQNSLDY